MRNPFRKAPESLPQGNVFVHSGAPADPVRMWFEIPDEVIERVYAVHPARTFEHCIRMLCYSWEHAQRVGPYFNEDAVPKGVLVDPSRTVESPRFFGNDEKRCP